MAIHPLIMCVYYSHAGHLVVWYSSQVVAATELGDALCERVCVEGNAVVPHHNTVWVCTQDDDLQLYRYKQPATHQHRLEHLSGN